MPMVWLGRARVLVNRAASTIFTGRVMITSGVATTPSLVQSRKLVARARFRIWAVSCREASREAEEVVPEGPEEEGWVAFKARVAVHWAEAGGWRGGG